MDQTPVFIFLKMKLYKKYELKETFGLTTSGSLILGDKLFTIMNEYFIQITKTEVLKLKMATKLSVVNCHANSCVLGFVDGTIVFVPDYSQVTTGNDYNNDGLVFENQIKFRNSQRQIHRRAKHPSYKNRRNEKLD